MHSLHDIKKHKTKRGRSLFSTPTIGWTRHLPAQVLEYYKELLNITSKEKRPDESTKPPLQVVLKDFLIAPLDYPKGEGP
jgi:hypothetical protein